jgi:hypothetical protein
MFDKTETDHYSKIVFGRFLKFIDRVLSILKTDIVPIFKSLVGGG